MWPRISGLLNFPTGLATSASSCCPKVSLSTGSSSPVTSVKDEIACDIDSLSRSLICIMNPLGVVSFSRMVPLTTSNSLPDKVIMTSLSTCNPFVVVASLDTNII